MAPFLVFSPISILKQLERIELPPKLLLGGLSMLNTKATTKNIHHIEMRPYNSIFTKNYYLDVEIGYKEVFRCEEHENSNANFPRCIVKGLYVDFLKFENWSADLELGYIEVCRRPGHNVGIQMSPCVYRRVYMLPSPLICPISRSEDQFAEKSTKKPP